MYHPEIHQIAWFLRIIVLVFGLGVLTSSWAQKPPLNVPTVVDVKAIIGNDTRPLNPHFLGCNVNMLRGGSWKDRRLIDLAKQLCATIRYPAGTIANWWDWKTGWFYKDLTDLPQKFARIPLNIYTLADLKVAYETTGADPIFVLNMLTSDLNYQLEMLKAAAKLGLPIKWIELGNEFYLEQPRYKQRFVTGRDYGKEASHWIAAIKTEFPNAKVAAVGILPRIGNKNGRIANWNSGLISEIKGTDAVILHWYTGSNLPQTRSAWKDMPEGDINPDSIASEAENRVFQTPAGLTDLLGQPFINLAQRTEQAQKEVPGSFKWWITEYNLRAIGKVNQGTWAHGLFTAVMTLNLLEIPRIELVCVHQLVGEPKFALISGFGPRDSSEVGLTASGHTFALLAAAMRGKTSALPVVFSPNRKAYTLQGQGYPSLVGWVFKGAGDSTGLLINLSGDTVRVASSGLGNFRSPWVQLAADPRKVIRSDSDLNRNEGKLQETIVFPPYSLTKIGK